jgi:translation initiation factor 2 gamma subunit (eIF-2gamma)
LIIATAGHVDHGKTSLVRNLTGVDTDRLAEEKRRGLSINLGFAFRQINRKTRLGFCAAATAIVFCCATTVKHSPWGWSGSGSTGATQ